MTVCFARRMALLCRGQQTAMAQTEPKAQEGPMQFGQKFSGGQGSA
jgi:hypothetical protein